MPAFAASSCQYQLACSGWQSLSAHCLAAAVSLPPQADAAPGFLLTLCTLVVWMKLVSYAHCHHDLRAAHRANLLRPGERGAPESNPEWARLRYPENLTLTNMLHYLAVPTLTYQVIYAKAESSTSTCQLLSGTWCRRPCYHC